MNGRYSQQHSSGIADMQPEEPVHHPQIRLRDQVICEQPSREQTQEKRDVLLTRHPGQYLFQYVSLALCANPQEGYCWWPAATTTTPHPYDSDCKGK